MAQIVGGRTRLALTVLELITTQKRGGCTAMGKTTLTWTAMSSGSQHPESAHLGLLSDPTASRMHHDGAGVHLLVCAIRGSTSTDRCRLSENDAPGDKHA